jgi:hypothetical protein
LAAGSTPAAAKTYPPNLPSPAPANILGFFGRKKKHQVFSPAAADKTLHALKLFLKLGK